MHLLRTLPYGSNGLPASQGMRTASLRVLGIPAYAAFLQVGFAVPAASPSRRWALTPPFHPCLIRHYSGHRRSIFCCTFPDLAVGGRYPPPCPVEPGLSSADYSDAITQSP